MRADSPVRRWPSMGKHRPEWRECEGGPAGALRKTRGWSEGGHKAEYKVDSKTRELDCGRAGGQNPSTGRSY